MNNYPAGAAHSPESGISKDGYFKIITLCDDTDQPILDIVVKFSFDRTEDGQDFYDIEELNSQDIINAFGDEIDFALAQIVSEFESLTGDRCNENSHKFELMVLGSITCYKCKAQFDNYYEWRNHSMETGHLY